MSLDEVQSVWNEQPIRSVSQSAALQHLTKARRSTIGGIFFGGLVLVSCLLTLWHQVNRALTDNAYTFANSYLDLAMTVAGIVLVLYGLAYVLRLQRDLRTFQNDTLSCLDRLIRSVRDDVRSIRRDLPLMFGGIVLLGVLSRVQLLRGGVDFSGGWAEIIFCGLGVLIVYAVFRFHLHVHVLPRLAALEKTRRDLAEEV